MVRFRVIKGSHLLLGVAAVALALVVCLLAFRLFAVEAGETAAAQTGGESRGGEASRLRRRPRARSSPLPPAAPGIEIHVLDGSGGTSSPPRRTNIRMRRFRPWILPAQESASPAPVESVPRVLIYHTHTHEAYEQTEADPYEALEAWRTADEEHSVVRVGEELAKLLRAAGLRSGARYHRP